MAGIKSIGTEDPEYYAELLCKTLRPTDRRLPLDEHPCPDVPGIQNVDSSLACRLQALLNTVADISLCQRGNVSATMARLKGDNGTLETRLYIVFNHEDDEAAHRCPQHLQHIFNMLRQVPYKPPPMGSPKLISRELENEFLEICTVIHNYSFDIFAHRVTKREHRLSDIQGYIEQDQTHFTPQDRSMLMTFLDNVGLIIKAVANTQNTKRLPTIGIKMLLGMYSYWTKHDLLPKDSLADNKFTLLDKVDKWLADVHGIGFQLRRWGLKIMSFLISANRLFIMTQSPRSRKLIEGKLSVQVLTSPTTAPYRCNLSLESVREALGAALAETEYLTNDWAEARESFIEQFPMEQDTFGVVCQNPTVHAELGMIMAMVKDEINVFPYIGVSKLSCIMCCHYIHAFNEVTHQKIATRGSHGKAYPGWFWPSLPSLDGRLRPAFLKRIRQQLVSDFEHHAGRRLSDSTVGSDALEWDIDLTKDELDELGNAYRRLGTVDTSI